MGFRYTELGRMMNEDRFADAAKIFVDKLVEYEINTAATEKRPGGATTHKAAFARQAGFGGDYCPVSRWATTLRDHGFDVIGDAKKKLEAHIAKSGQATTATS